MPEAAAPPPAPGERSVQPDPRILDAYPTRADEAAWDVVDARAVIAVPKVYSRVERFLARFFPGPDVVFLTLDALGTEAWLAADGTRTVRDIAARLQERFGEDAEPAEGRATAFFTDLARRRFVRLFEDARPAADPLKGFTEARGFRAITCRHCERPHPIRAPTGARYACPRCRRINRV